MNKDCVLWIFVLVTTALAFFSYYCTYFLPFVSLYVCMMTDRLLFFSILEQREPYHTQHPAREEKETLPRVFFLYNYIYIYLFFLFFAILFPKKKVTLFCVCVSVRFSLCCFFLFFRSFPI
jgi:hypothetical protein